MQFGSSDILNFYDGGSEIDTILSSVTGFWAFTVSSTGNQMFISFTTDGHGSGKGFSALITCGKETLLNFLSDTLCF